jgi:phosphate transport system permease protein
MDRRKVHAQIGVWMLRASVGVAFLFLVLFMYMIFSKGGKVLSWSFLVESPQNGMTEGGIFPAIIGTFYLTILSIVIALPLGIFTAIYLTNYANKGLLLSTIRVAINTLAGVPSIIYGLFGMAIFVNLFDLGVSMISGALTLAVLIMPVIINTTEEAIKSVPEEFIQGSLALGANKRQTIFRVVLPTAFPNILTGTIISIGRAAGETAPILFTAATFYTIDLPMSVFDEVMALPYHIYALMTEGTHAEQQVPIAYGTAVVLLMLVLLISASAIAIRYKMRKNRTW